MRHDVVAFAPQLGDEPLGRRLLGGRGVEYLGTVLVAEVGALPVFLGRVVDFEEQACQRLVGHLCRIEYHTYGFGMSRRWDFRSCRRCSPTRPSGLRALSKAYIPRPRNNLRQRSPSRHAPRPALRAASRPPAGRRPTSSQPRTPERRDSRIGFRAAASAFRAARQSGLRIPGRKPRVLRPFRPRRKLPLRVRTRARRS